MKQRVPDSSRLPLRAMVMVLLFLGVIFLLVGLQAVDKEVKDDNTVPPIVGTNTPTTTTTKKPQAQPKANVVVLNTTSDEGLGGSAAERLTSQGFNVVETRNERLPSVTETTVFFGDAPGERAAADEVGRVMDAPVEPRGPGLADQPPGIIVAVTG